MRENEQLSIEIQRNVSQALAEDVGTGDLTARLIPPGRAAQGLVTAREEAVLHETGIRELRVGDEIELGGRAIRVLPAQHTVPAVGYAVRSAGGTLAFSGDTTVCDEFWSAVNALPDLRYLIIETAFPDRDRQLAVMSRHLCPDMLASELQKLERPAEIYITHLKPSQMIMTMREIAETLGALQPRMLRNNHVFDF